MSMCEFPGAVTGKKICITNRQLLTGTTEYTAEVRERFLQRLSLIARHHLADGVILREKELSARQYEELAGAAYHICRAHDLPLILHHFAETAAGFTPVLPLHLSMPEFLALKAGDEKLQFPAIGVSTHTVQEALEAEALGASYILRPAISFPPPVRRDCRHGAWTIFGKYAAPCPSPSLPWAGFIQRKSSPVLGPVRQGCA